MSSPLLHVAIAGAAGLRGKDLKESLEESSFPAGDVRLLDEELAAGTLTEVGGEPAIVQTIDEDSFEHERFVFFTGSAQFAAKHAAAAERAGATVIDLTGASAGDPASAGGPRSQLWIPRLDSLLPPPATAGRPVAAGKTNGGMARYVAPSAAAIVACTFSAALKELSPARLAMVFLAPVSERGQEGVDELQNQTVNLFAFQTMPQDVFGTQVAFNLMDRWGTESIGRFADARAALDREVRAYLAGRSPMPAMTLVQAPVFFGLAFSVYAEFAGPVDAAAAAARLEAAGARMISADDPDPEPSNLSVAGSSEIVVRGAQADPGVPGGYWFWGAADNMRLASSNAVNIAEKLLVA